MKPVLADTGPLYALVDRDDRYHGRSHAELNRLLESGLTLLVAFPTLMEAYTLVLRRLGFGAAQTWLEEMSAGAGLVNPDRKDYLEAGRRAGLFADQGITLFDALVVVLSEELEAAVWTYDHHFDLMRAAVWR